MKYVVFYMCRTIKILISNWPRKLKFSQFLQAGKTCQLLLTFLTKVTRWSRSTSNFYALIGQNLTGEFTRKIYAASGNLLSWGWRSILSSCDFYNCLFPLDVQNEIQLLSRQSSFIYGWFVYWGFVWEMHRLSKSLEIRFRMASCSPRLMRKRNEKSQAILALLEGFQGLYLDW